MLLAGSGARAGGVAHPSYADPAATTVLGRRGDRAAWARVRADGLATVRELTGYGTRRLPDWALVASVSHGETSTTTGSGAAGGPGAVGGFVSDSDTNRATATGPPGDPGATRSAAAPALDAEQPTYYGPAWIALVAKLLARPC